MTGYAAIVLAGDRGPEDVVARATGAPCKALAPVAGRPLLERVLESLGQSPIINRCIVVGPSREIFEAYPALRDIVTDAGARWVEPGDTPSISAVRGLDELDPGTPALITTADHALLDGTMIQALCSAPAGVDLSVGLIEYARVKAAYPDSRRTAIRLGSGSGYCGCNLFAAHTPRASALVARWRAVEAQRKHPARVVAGMLGWGAVLRYGLRRLSLEDAFGRLSERSGVCVAPVMLDNAQAAVDVDSTADLALVERILGARASGATAV